jgi:hypothetical protein
MSALCIAGSTHPCSVLQCCRVEADHWDNFIVNILAAHFFVMRWGVVISEIIREIFAAWIPIDSVLFLCDSISDPVESDVHCL